MDRKLKVSIFAILFFIFFYKIFLGYGILDGDLFDEYVPKLVLIKNSFSKFVFPLYEKSFGLGFPIYKDIQNCFYYPLNWLVLLPFDVFFIVQIITLLNVLIFFTGIYILLKKLKVEDELSFIISFLSTFSSFFVSHIPHYTMLSSLSISPYVIFFLVGFYENSNRKNFIITVIFFFLLLLAGHPQIFFYTVILSFIIVFLKYSSLKNFVYFFMAIFFSTFVSLFILMPTFNVFKYSYRNELDYNILPLKYLILTIFPDLFGGVSRIFRSEYQGTFNINETSFYFSLIFFFTINYSMYVTILKKEFKNFSKMIVPLLFLSLSFFNFFGFKIFLSPTRSIYLFVISFMFFFMFDMLKNLDKRFLLFNVSVFILLLVLIIVKGFCFERFILQILFFTVYTLFFYYDSIKKFQKKIKFSVLVVIIFFDIFLSTGGILKFEKLKNLKNESYDFLKDKYIITYIPEDVLFYKDYIKDHFKVDNLEILKRYSSFGNRGIYYGAHSFNLYQNFTFKKYVDFFDDPMIMQGGFSNINFLFNPLFLNYDYVFVPDIPIILNIKNFLTINFRENFSDTFIIFYTGELKNITEYDRKEEYLKDVKDLKCGLLVVKGSMRIYGNGKIYMMKKFSTGKILHFPYLFENSNFQTVSKKPFYLFKRHTDLISENCFVNPIDGSLEKLRKRYLPMDLVLGIFISLISFIALLFYSKKEFENV
ncbi:MAG: hypothetical protein ABIN00_06980 [candidate division WOR-3 bacterium]